jgi:3-methyl-2-oxobutanoate hydroxymethyltransferase
MLVGDSLGMTVQGHDSTLPVTVEDIAYHTRAVRRGAPACLLLSDLPFMAYATPEPLKTRHRDARRRQYGQN